MPSNKAVIAPGQAAIVILGVSVPMNAIIHRLEQSDQQNG